MLILWDMMNLTDSEKFRLHVVVFPQWPHRDTAHYALAFPQCVVGFALNQLASNEHASAIEEILVTVGCAEPCR